MEIPLFSPFVRITSEFGQCVTVYSLLAKSLTANQPFLAPQPTLGYSTYWIYQRSGSEPSLSLYASKVIGKGDHVSGGRVVLSQAKLVAQ